MATTKKSQSVGVQAVDAYLSGVPEPHKTALQQLRQILRELLPQAEECLSYGVPAFKVNGKAIAGYAAAKNHCSYFPHSGQVIEELASQLRAYDLSKGTLRFSPQRSLPKSLVKKLIAARFAQLGM